jgi:glycosyltransferase involved in cell wall biosynthesis
MPTQDRRQFIPAAIDCWMRQTYENRDLVIVDDGDDPIEDIIPNDPRIFYFRLDRKITTGAKRNKCCALASGSIICHFDDDDWSAPDRIVNQVARLLGTGKPITGYSQLLFWDTLAQQAKRYQAQVPNYVVGTSLMYKREHWLMSRFKDQQKSSDNAFVYPSLSRIAASNDPFHMVARIHGSHTSAKSAINDTVPRSMIPAEFWTNERLRIG